MTERYRAEPREKNAVSHQTTTTHTHSVYVVAGGLLLSGHNIQQSERKRIFVVLKCTLERECYVFYSYKYINFIPHTSPKVSK